MGKEIYKDQFTYSVEKETVHLYGQLVVGAAGAVTSFAGGGFVGCTKQVADGQYEIELLEGNRLLEVSVVSVLGSASGVARAQIFETPATFQADFKADKKFKIQLLDFAGAAVNAASGEYLYIKVVYRRSSVDQFLS